MPTRSPTTRRRANPAAAPRGTAFSEHAMQVDVFRWAELMQRVHPPLESLYAVPNAGKRTARAAAWAKAEGLRPGVLDVCLPVPRGGYGALYVEHKMPGKTLTDEQRDWAGRLARAGNAVVVSYSFDTTVAAILAYLANRFDAWRVEQKGTADGTTEAHS